MATTQSGEAGGDVIEILTDDHREMLDLVGQIEGTTDSQRRRDLADTVIAEVMRHAVAEEMYVYPAIGEHVPGGAGEVEHDKQEHDELVTVMKQIEDIDTSDPRFMQLVWAFEGQLRHHVEDEEKDQFLKLREHPGGDASRHRPEGPERQEAGPYATAPERAAQ